MRLLLLALLATALQDTTGTQEARGFVFKVPKGWSSAPDPNPGTNATVLTPPGAGQNAQVILYPVTENVELSPQDVHDTMVKLISSAGTVEGETKTGTTGRFQWTRMKAALPGATMWMALYTAKSGTKAGTVVFGAMSKELFEKHLAGAEGFVQELRFAGAADPLPAAAAPGLRQIHGLVLPLGPGWTTKNEAGGIVALFPPPPRSVTEPRWDYVMYVLPSQPLKGTFWETHKAVFQDALKSSGLKNPVPPSQRADVPGPFIYSASAGHDAAGGVRSISLYSALSDGKIECILVHHQEDLDTIRGILGRTTLKNPPQESQRPRILEIYRRANQKQFINPSGGAFIPGSLQYERICLRNDGVADFATYYAEGYAASPDVLKLDRSLENGDVGSWKAEGDDKLRIVRNAANPAEIYVRENGRLRQGDQVWQPMPRVDGLRYQGRWGAAGPPRIAIEFTREGRFKDEGLLEHVAFGDTKRPKPPKKGAGTYELREWTIFLKYDDGTAWSTDFSSIGADPKDDSSLIFRTSAFQKE